jgi:DNA polymerase-3 subunit chi
MAKISFYLLAADSAEERLRFVCRLTETIYKRGHQLYIHAQDAEQAKAIDALLWTDKADSFIAHRMLADNKPCPILIGHGEQCPSQTDTVLTLAHPAPAFYQRFQRVVEVISQQPEVLANSRHRYRHYQSQGDEIIIHDLKQQENSHG